MEDRESAEGHYFVVKNLLRLFSSLTFNTYWKMAEHLLATVENEI